MLLRILAMDEESLKINHEKVLLGEQMNDGVELKVEGWWQCLFWKLLYSYEELGHNNEHLLHYGSSSRNAQVLLQLRKQEKQNYINQCDENGGIKLREFKNVGQYYMESNFEENYFNFNAFFVNDGTLF